MLKIKTDKGYFDHATDFTIAVEEKSPVMNDRGSQTVPATVPPTPHNLLITGFAHRLDCAAEPMKDKTCTVVDGVYFRTGVINLVSASKKDGITFNVGFDNSEAYEAWKKKKMNELTLPVIGSGDVDALRATLQTAYTEGDGGDFAVFPIAVEREEISSGNTKVVYWGMINQVNNGTLVSGARTQRQPVGGTPMDVTVPNGYGVSPFLYVWRALELVFSALGYEIEANPFKVGDLAKLVILNNVADCIVNGYLRYSDLMPDCEVKAFLTSLYVRFGLVYLLNQDTKKVKLELVRNIITKYSRQNLTDVLAEWPLVNFGQHKQLKLSAKTSLYNAEPTNERLEDYLKGQSLYNINVVDERSPDDVNNKFIYERITGKFYRWDEDNNQYTDSVSGWWVWDPQSEGVEVEALSSEDECVPMLKVDDVYYPGYITGAVHRHSYIKGRESDKEKNQTPLAFVISYGQRGRITPPGDAPAGSLSLLFQYSDGLFARFWQGYDAVLRHAFEKVEVTARMTPAQILRLKLLDPVMLQGQPMLLDGFNYTLPAPSRAEVLITLRTLRLKNAENLETEQNIPAIGNATKTWKWIFAGDNLSQAIAAKEEEICQSHEYIRESLLFVGVTPVDPWRDDPYWDWPPGGPRRVTKSYTVTAEWLGNTGQGHADEHIWYDITYDVIMVGEYS